DLERSDTPIGLAQALLFRAYAEFRSNESEAAAQSLAQACATAERVGHDQMLVSEALGVRGMLDAMAARPDIGARAAALLARAEAVGTLQSQSVAAPSGRSLPATFQVFALGQGRLLKEGTEISKSEWISQRTRELFFFLIDRLPIARDEILKTFWPEKPLARAVANLYQTLYRLRRVVGGELVILENQICRLAPGFNFEYDVTRFEEQARQALLATSDGVQRLGRLASAAALCSGEYLSDLAADWSLARRESLNELQVNVLREYARELMHVTRYAEARDSLAKAVAIEPFDDGLHAQILTCLERMGRRHEVVDYYRRYRDTLRAELGLDPPAEIRALYSRLID
ncbi:MAG TPA: BTAD domain-containing putative transcriptional regulator, partial [Anaerolineae bacterium]